MNINPTIVIIVVLLIAVLLILFFRKNAKDKKAYSEDLNATEIQPERHDETKEPE